MARYDISNRALLSLAAVFITLLVAVGLRTITMPAFASEAPVRDYDAIERMVTIFDGNRRINIRTRVATVYEVIYQAGLRIEPADTVEPALDEEMVGSQFFVNIYRARPVTITDGSTRRIVMTSQANPRDIAAEADLALHERDLITLTPVTAELFLETGTNIHFSISRAKIITLNFFGREFEVRTNASTVSEFLEEQRLTLSDGDQVSRPLDHVLQTGDYIALANYGTRVITFDEDIPYETRTIHDFNQPSSFRREESSGQIGRRTVTFEIQIVNGEEVGRTVLHEIIHVAPVDRVLVVGARASLPSDHEAWMRAAGIPEIDWGYVNFIIHRESRWTYTAVNRSSGAYGLCQALPASRMYEAGPDWRYNPVTQLRWCHSYAMSRYHEGSRMLRGVSCSGLRRGWQCAVAFWQVHRWW